MKNLKRYFVIKSLSDDFLLVGGFVLVRILPFIFYLASFGVQIAPDSGTYRYGFFRWDVLDNHRGYGITVPFTLSPNDLCIVILQFSLVTISGILLIAELKKSESNFKYLAIIAVFALLNSPTVAIWDVWLLSHSLTLAYNIFSFTFFIKYCKYRKSKHLFLFGMFLFLSSISRPNNQVALVILLSASIFWLYRSKNFELRPKKTYSRAVLSIFLGCLVILSVVINSNLETKWSPKLPVAILPYILDVNVPVSSDIIRAAKADASVPKCAFPATPLTSDNGNYLKKVYSECPKGVDWLENDFELWYLKFLLSNPKTTLNVVGFGTTVGLGFPINYGEYYATVFPEPILKMFIGVPKVGNGVGIYPLFGWTLLVFLLGLRLRARMYSSVFPNSNDNSLELDAYLVAWLASACLGIIYQSHGDNFRIFIDNQVIITLVAVYLVSIKLAALNKIKS